MISSKILDLLKKIQCVYDNYGMYSISIEMFSILPMVQSNDFCN
jgi:hypothetical protein